jgi:clathrin heavy chain
MPVNP